MDSHLSPLLPLALLVPRNIDQTQQINPDLELGLSSRHDANATSILHMTMCYKNLPLPPTLLFHPSNMMTLERTPDTTEPPKPAPELELVSLAKLTRNTVQRLAPFCQIRLPCVSLSSSFYSMLDSVYLMV
ncbi:hypothetical protein Ac2012v2_007473 [Leucoagaricus gongylophorus]